MKSANAPYLLVLSCAEALSDLVKVRALAEQLESFKPKLEELGDFLSKFSEVRNELGKRLSSGRLNDAELTLIHERLLSLSELSESLGALVANTELQICRNLPALACEITNEVNSWKMSASRSTIAELDEVINCGHALVKDVASKLERASKLELILSDCRNLIESNSSPHVLFETATDLLTEAWTLTSDNLIALLDKSKKWGENHEAFSKDYKNLIQLLTKNLDEIDLIMSASTDDCRQSLADYYRQIASWLAALRTFLSRASRITAGSALALGQHSTLKENYSNSQNYLGELRSTIAEYESASAEEKIGRAIRAARRINFAISILGIFGAAIGLVWLGSYASMFAVAILISFFGFLCAKGENDKESSLWSVNMMVTFKICAVGALLVGADWLLGYLFNQWSLIRWLPKWSAAFIPVSFWSMLALGYAVTMCCLVFRNFLPLRREKPQALQSPTNETFTADSEPSFVEIEPKESPSGRESRLTPPPTLFTLSKPAKATTRVPTRPAITHPSPHKPTVQTIPALSPSSDAEPSLSTQTPETEIPPQLFSRIRDRLKREYRGDSEKQRSELESQIKSYRALQDIITQPLNGLDVQTLEKIVSRAQMEDPLDLDMQLFEVERQIECHAEVEHFSESATHSEVPSVILNMIVGRAKREHLHDFTHQALELREQMSAYIKLAEMHSSPHPGMTRKQMTKAIADAEREYPDDYSMQIYHIEQGFEDDTE